MSKPQHPYPDHIRQAVATTIARQVLVMRSWSDLTKQTRDAFLTDADEVLQSLWDASRVPDLDSIDELPEHAIVLDKDGFCAIGREHAITDITNHDLPAHVIHWGDSDE